MTYPPARDPTLSVVLMVDSQRERGGWALGSLAPVIAFIEEHVIVLDGWTGALLRAHEGPWAAVCAQMSPPLTSFFE